MNKHLFYYVYNEQSSRDSICQNSQKIDRRSDGQVNKFTSSIINPISEFQAILSIVALRYIVISKREIVRPLIYKLQKRFRKI